LFVLGIAIPSQDILYTTLGTLIKERKIYHTGEGYFIVTPQTYFITSTTTQENKKVLSAKGHLVPTSVTYLVSLESCAELVEEDTAPFSHCPSCQCFPDVCTQDIAAEVTRKGHKGLGESTPLVQNQAVSAFEQTGICESPKLLPYTKDKEKGKRFGFSLLWRSISRKEKPKTQHSSFSAQFPPEEWPVRDEDNLDNIPRDVEHEIIKRINPVLTVDNLTKHTLLMQKYEEQKKYNSQGTSTNMLTAMHKYPLKEGLKKRQPCRRGRSHQHRHKAGNQGSEPQPGSIRLEKHPKLPATQPAFQIKSPNEGEVQKLLGDNTAVLGSHLIYKKQISNPFQGLSHRRNPRTKGCNIQKTSDLKPTQTGPKEKTFERSRSSGPSGIFDGEAQQSSAEQCHDKQKVESIYITGSHVQPAPDDFRDGLMNYPQCNVVRNNIHCCSFRESMLRSDVYSGENKAIPEVLRKSQFQFDKLGETEEAQPILPSQGSSSLDPTSSVCQLVDETVYQFQNLGLLDYPVGGNHLRQHKRQHRDSKALMRKSFVPEAEMSLFDEDHALYQDEVEDDDGDCSSLYLDDDDFSEKDNLCQMLPECIQYSFEGGGKWKQEEGKPKVAERSLTEYSSKLDRFESEVLKRNARYKPTGLLAKPRERQNSDLSAESSGLNSGTQLPFHSEEEPDVAKCVQASASADGSSFHSYSTRKTSSDAEILQHSIGDTGKKPASWSQNQELRKHFTQKLEFFSAPCLPVLAQDIQNEHNHLEGTESHSMAGDSGIDSPW
jgi:hypothetical protein